MDLKGNLSTFSLAEVFQSISSAQKQGTLVVWDKESRKAIYFSKTGVKLLSSGKRKGMQIGELLLKLEIITEEQLNKALVRQKETGQRIGKILEELGYLKQDDIQKVVRFQIEEEIYDLFTWPDASFEFIEGEPPPELKKPDNPITEIELDANALVSEAMFRINEWEQINQSIPHPQVIFTLTHEGEQILRQRDLNQVLKIVLPLINGIRTVEEVIQQSHLARFGAAKAIYTLLSKGAIRQIELGELKANARETFRKGNYDQALLLYQQAAKINPKDITVAANLAEVLEHLKRKQEAGEQYKYLGDLFKEKDGLKQTVLAYEKAIQYLSEDTELHQTLLDLYVQEKNQSKIIQTGRRLLEIYINQNNLAKIEELGRHLASLVPEDVELQMYIAENLAGVLERLEKPQEAAEQYKSLGKLWAEKGDLSQAVSAYEKAGQYLTEDEELHQTLLDLYVKEKNQPKIIQTGRRLLELYTSQNNLAKVEEFGRHLVSLVPKDTELQIYTTENLAKLLEHLDKHQEASEQYRHLGNLLKKKGEINQAALAYEKAGQYLTEDEELHQTIFDLYIKENNQPKITQTGKHLLQFYANQNNLAKVEKLSRQLTKLVPEDTELQVYITEHLAGVLERLEKHKEAAEQYKALGKLLTEKGELTQASSAYEKAGQYLSHDTEFQKTLLDLHIKENNQSQIIQSGKRLLELYINQDNLAQAEELSRNLAGLVPDDAEFRAYITENLASVLERLEKSQESAEQYRHLGNLLKEKGELSQAASAYEKASQYFTDDEELHQTLLDLYIKENNQPKIIQFGKQLLQFYTNQDNLTKAEELSRNLLNQVTPDFELYTYISKVYYDLKDYKKSKTVMDTAIKELHTDKMDDLIKAYQEIIRIEPHHADARYRLDSLLRVKTRRARRKRLIVELVILGIALIALIASVVSYENRAWQELQVIKTQVDELVKQGKYEKALFKYQRFGYPLTLANRARLKKEIREIKTKIKEREARKQEAVVKDLEGLTSLYQKLLEQEKTSQDLRNELAGYKRLRDKADQKKYDELSSKISSRIESISKYLKKARDLYDKARDYDRKGDLDRARILMLELVHKYSQSPKMKLARLPLKVETSPAKATIKFNGRKQGVTPIKIYLPLKGTSTLSITKKGFKTVQKKIEGYKQSYIKINLERKPFWVYQTNGPIEAGGVVSRGVLYIGSRDGNLYALDVVTGEKRWQFRTEGGSGITAPVVIYQGYLFVGCYEGLLYKLRLNSGLKVWQVKTNGSIKAGVSLSSNGKVIYVGSADKNLYAIANDSGDIIWQFPVSGKILTSPWLIRNSVYVVSEDGHLYCINAQKGDLIWKQKLKITGEIRANPLVSGDMLYLGSLDHHIYAINLSQRKIKWQYKTKGEITAKPLLYKNTLYVASKDSSLYALRAINGSFIRKFTTNGPITASPVLAKDGKLYLGSEDKCLYAIDTKSNKILWKYKTGDKIRSTPVLSKNLVLIGSNDRKIYALER